MHMHMNINKNMKHKNMIVIMNQQPTFLAKSVILGRLLFLLARHKDLQLGLAVINLLQQLTSTGFNVLQDFSADLVNETFQIVFHLQCTLIISKSNPIQFNSIQFNSIIIIIMISFLPRYREYAVHCSTETGKPDCYGGR